MKQQITKAMIETAFRTLLQQKPFEKITVKDIVEECGLTRNTFYYHFEDIYDVFGSLLEKETESILEEDRLMRQQNPNCPNKSWDAILLDAIHFSLVDRQIANHVFKSQNRDELEMYFGRAIEKVLQYYIDVLAKDSDFSQRDQALLLGFYRDALQGAIRRWIADGMKTPLQDDLARLGFLLDGQMEAALRRGKAYPET